ncbi:MAG: AraC family transcriptional regulator [Chitinophagaceae bacterium]|nr:MAG: AraC family transcriptional regulator [Chitinophagaceae bacterium]
MRHVEFIDREHFEKNYFRQYPTGKLAGFIDFFWQTRFTSLLQKKANGFSDLLFPNTGYSYLINIGTPYVMMMGESSFPIKGDSFLPRHQRIECFHQPGNEIFGIKFRLSPVLLEKKINFSEYRKAMSPLSYLIDKQVVESVKREKEFSERVEILSSYFNKIIRQSGETSAPAKAVSSILHDCYQHNAFGASIEDFAAAGGISSRTLHRYFECATSLSSKKTLQLMRIRKAVEELMHESPDWNFLNYGYYDYSHFYRHLVQFMGKDDAGKFMSDRRGKRS